MDIKETAYFTIYQKITNRKNIIADSIFNMTDNLVNTMQFINNFKKYFNDDWGYRIYIDDSIDISLLKTINDLDFIEIYNIKIKDITLINKNINSIDILKKIYHFHASTDTNKDLIYFKDNTLELKDFLELNKKFENSNKIVCCYLVPWYKPFIDTLSKFPFNIPNYFWGIKPKLYLEKYINYHYNFDNIFEFIIKFDNNPNILENNYICADEIILTELIFSYFQVKDIYFFVQKYDLNTLLLFFIIYEELKNNTIFVKILEDNFEKIKYKIPNNQWNNNSLNDFLFNDINNINCIFPYYNKIIDKNITKIYYYAYIKTLYNLIECNDEITDNINMAYYKYIIKYMKEYLPLYNNNELMEYIKIINNESIFNLCYNTKLHIPKILVTKEIYNPLWNFISETIFSVYHYNLANDIIKQLYNIFFIINKNNFIYSLNDNISNKLILRIKNKYKKLKF